MSCQSLGISPCQSGARCPGCDPIAEVGYCSAFAIAFDLRLRLDGGQFREGSTMRNSKITMLAYALAVGFILAVAFHSPSKQMVAASEPVLTPVVDLK
jgi:hypothetical protein